MFPESLLLGRLDKEAETWNGALDNTCIKDEKLLQKRDHEPEGGRF
jgi:hypothetical protein